MIVAGTLRRNTKITATTSATDSINSNSTSCTEARMVVVRSVSTATSSAAGSAALRLGSNCLMRIDDRDDIGARLALDIEDDRRRLCSPTRQAWCFRRCPVTVGDIRQPHRRAVFIGDDDIVIFVGAFELVVGVDGVGAHRPVETAFGRIDIGVADGGAQIVDIEAVGGQRLRDWRWMRTAGRWPPEMLTRPTPGNCEIFCARRVSARSSTCVSGSVLEVTASVRTGASAGLTLA